VNEDYRAIIDGRTFDFGVRDGYLRAARDAPAVELRAHASDLADGRRRHPGAIPASRTELHGQAAATTRFLSVFRLKVAQELPDG
jgi:hypothetical protein